MLIYVTAGTGAGSTRLSAFDSALYSAGIANANLLFLSSIIPAGAEVELVEPGCHPLLKNTGDRLEVVMAKAVCNHQQEQAVAGLGWALQPGVGGFFIEASGIDGKAVTSEIEATYREMSDRRGLSACLNKKLVQHTSDQKYFCSLVAAIYRCSSWNGGGFMRHR